MTKEQTAVKATYFSIVSNTFLALIKGLAGYFGNSYALTADAIESTTDILNQIFEQACGSKSSLRSRSC
jgi:divalent metal cation (Fe/Co/Zn/Cd) transporter